MWTLEYNGIIKSIEAWGLSNVRLTLRSQAPDTLCFEAIDQDIDAPPLFNYGEILILYRQNIRWFYGPLTRQPRRGSGAGESLEYEAAGPWWYLSDLTYQQHWAIKNQAQGLKGRVILGQGPLGQGMHTGQAIADILSYATSASRPLSVGLIDPSTPFPKDEHKDITCAEAINRILAWHPDCITYFDYTTLPYPTLHIRKKGSLPAISLDLNAGTILEEIRIAPREDLVRSALIIKYEISGITSGQPWTNIVTDAYPLGASGQEIGAMVVTVPLDGPNVTWVQQRVVTRPIEDDPLDPKTTSYWKKLVPALAAANLSNIAFEDLPGEPAGTKFKRRQADPDEKDLFGNTIPFKNNLDNELVEGAITDWMRTSLALPVDAQYQVLVAHISYQLNGVPQGPFLFSHQLTATNASSQIYSMWQVDDQGDPVPEGIAQSLYQALGALQFQGKLNLIEKEASGIVTLGQTLNVIGGRPEWTTMGALVQEVSFLLDQGRSEIAFGPLGSIGARGLVDLMRVTRPSAPGRMADGNTGAAAMRASGKPKQLVSLGVTQANSNTTSLANPASPGANLDFPFRLTNASGAGHARLQISLGSVMAQAGSYQNPIFPKLWNGIAWTSLGDPSAPLLELPDFVGIHWIYLKAQFNFLRYIRKIGIFSNTSGLPSDQLPLQSYLPSGEDLTGWTTPAGDPDNPPDCGLAHRLIGLVEVEQSGTDFQVKEIITPQDLQGNLGLIPASSGNHVWYRI